MAANVERLKRKLPDRLAQVRGDRSQRQFARDLDANEHVRLFVKLPSWFKIDTPVGPYNPDWAFVTERDEKLYFVRETKSTLESEERRLKENQKVECGRKHFRAIGVNFDVVTAANPSLSAIKKRGQTSGLSPFFLCGSGVGLSRYGLQECP